MCVAEAKLPVLVPTKGVELPLLSDHKAVCVPTGDLSDPLPCEEGDRLGQEHVVAVAVPEPAKVSPAKPS